MGLPFSLLFFAPLSLSLLVLMATAERNKLVSYGLSFPPVTMSPSRSVVYIVKTGPVWAFATSLIRKWSFQTYTSPLMAPVKVRLFWKKQQWSDLQMLFIIQTCYSLTKWHLLSQSASSLRSRESQRLPSEELLQYTLLQQLTFSLTARLCSKLSLSVRFGMIYKHAHKNSVKHAACLSVF